MIIIRSQFSNVRIYKLAVYKKLLEQFKTNRQQRICLGLSNLTEVSYKCLPGVFVEIYRQRPSLPYSDAWWFDPDDVTSRMRLIENAIKELECQQ
jgi:hypothetical protein